MKSIVEYIDHMGTDKTVVNAARVSFDADSAEGSTVVTDADRSLIQFLARGCRSGEWDTRKKELGCAYNENSPLFEHTLNYIRKMPTHWTPFAHCVITLRETVPIFVARQRTTHSVGLVYNEISRRYVDQLPQMYTFDTFRSRPGKDIKQGSGGEHPDSEYWVAQYSGHMDDMLHFYNRLIRDGVAPEQARAVLPQSMMTSYWVTGSLYAFANSYNARSDAHAQKEIGDIAAEWQHIIRPLFPVSWDALTN